MKLEVSPSARTGALGVGGEARKIGTCLLKFSLVPSVKGEKNSCFTLLLYTGFFINAG
jgi:hypothetical protein